MADGTHSGEIALVTGANKGIGKEVARRLAATGMTVYLGARDEARGKTATAELGATGADVRFLHLDVTDQGQVDVAAQRVAGESGRLDVLVNNAGVVVERGLAMPEVTADHLRRTYEVNVFGMVAVTRAFLPLLRRSSCARVVNLSSPLGSLGLLSDPDSMVAQHALLAYSSSKSAVNSLTLLYARALKSDGILVNAANPGYVATDLNDHRGVLTVEQGAHAPTLLALLGPDGPSGTFQGLEDVIPW
ncbi:MAG TPA: SDR family oxidoreductase [Candidatus Limnocylindrales bacterium]